MNDQKHEASLEQTDSGFRQFSKKVFE